MKTSKKTVRKPLEKYSTLFMQLGLVCTLFIVYVLLEYKTEEIQIVSIDYKPAPPVFFPDDVPLIILKEVPKEEIVKPKEKPPVLDLGIIEKGEDIVIETILKIDNTAQVAKEINIALSSLIDLGEGNPPPEDVPFLLIEDAPVYKGCEGLSKAANKKCFKQKVKEFVQKNFDADLAQNLGLQEGKYKMYTQFIIDKQGNVTGIKVRAPHKKLEKELVEILQKLPKFIPGKQRKKPVKVRYILPITFRVEN